MSLHDVECGFAPLNTPGLPRFLRFFQIAHMEAADGDIGFVAVLFPEQPFIHFRLCKRILWQECTAPAEEAEDCIRLRQRVAIVELHHGHLAMRIELQERVRSRLSLQDVDILPFVFQTKNIGRVFDLQAVAGLQIAENFHRRSI